MKQKSQGRVVLRAKQAIAIEITPNANASTLRKLKQTQRYFDSGTALFIFN